MRDDTILGSVERHDSEEPDNGVELSSERQFRAVENQLIQVWRGVLGGDARISGRSGFAGRRYQAVSIPKTGIYRRDYQPKTPTPIASSSPIAPVNPAGAQQGSRAAWPIYIVAAVLLYGLIRIIFAVT